MHTLYFDICDVYSRSRWYEKVEDTCADICSKYLRRIFLYH